MISTSAVKPSRNWLAKTPNLPICYFVSLGNGKGYCPKCDPDYHYVMPLGSLRHCWPNSSQPPGLPKRRRAASRYPLLARNDLQLSLIKACCRDCDGLDGFVCKWHFRHSCQRSARKLLSDALVNANVSRWCPVWIEKLGLIGDEATAIERVNRFIQEEQLDERAYDARAIGGGTDPSARPEVEIQTGERCLPEAASGPLGLDPGAAGLPKRPDVQQALALQRPLCSGRVRSADGRGIVILGGGDKYLPGTYANVRLLRELGCKLPIEIWHLGQREMPGQWADRFMPHIQSIRDAWQDCRMRYQTDSTAGHWLYGYEAKLYAMQWSQFDEVLLLDSDSYPVRDPAYLFDEPAYRQTGAVFWPDSVRTGKQQWFAVQRDTWRVFGIPENEYRDEREHETGQMLIDKQRCWDALTLCNWYMKNGRNFYFHYQLGDKDVPHMAWRKLRMPFALAPDSTPEKTESLQSVLGCLIQFDFAGRRLFQHRIAAKLKLPAAANLRLPGFLHEERLLEFLKEVDL